MEREARLPMRDPATEPLTDRGRDITRRRVLQVLTAAGAASAAFARTLLAQDAGAGKISAGMVQRAEWLTGIEFTDGERRVPFMSKPPSSRQRSPSGISGARRPVAESNQCSSGWPTSSGLVGLVGVDHAS